MLSCVFFVTVALSGCLCVVQPDCKAARQHNLLAVYKTLAGVRGTRDVTSLTLSRTVKEVRCYEGRGTRPPPMSRRRAVSTTSSFLKDC